MQFCTPKILKNKTPQIFAQIGCFASSIEGPLGQIFQTRPNFIDLGALVCDSNTHSSIYLK